MTIYGNAPVQQLIRTMAARDRIPHACLLYGEKGMGRKTLARYFAMTALCTGEEKPCGMCPSCRKILSDNDDTHPHPDFIYVPHAGKKGGFLVDTVREVCKDAIVAPNDGERKVYLFTDCDNIDIRAQNTLLKLTEEPPPHVLLLFTALHQGAFLETMRSRIMPIAVLPCTQEECRQALLEHDVAPADAQRASECCGGNIGRALAWLEDDDMQQMTGHITALTHAIAAKDTYEVLRLLSLYEKDRQCAQELLRLLDLQLRDALLLRFGREDVTGCDRKSAEKLHLSAGRSAAMHDAIQEAYEQMQANVSLKLVLAALGGRLMG